MKNLFVAAAVLAMAVPAMASKARLTALSNSYHLTDNRSGLLNPALMGADHVTFEMGAKRAATGATAAPHSEGGFVKTSGAGKWSAYLGRNYSDISARPTAMAINENPIDLGYSTKAGDMEWGVGLAYSNSDKKTTATHKQSRTDLKAGVVTGPWDAYLNLALADTAENVTSKYKGGTGADLYAGYTMENNYFYGEYLMSGGKTEPAAGGVATADLENSTISLGYVNSTKMEGAEFFYGVAYNMVTNKDKATTVDSKTETTSLPFTIGLEAEATSWMTLRGSVKQNVLLGSTKSSAGAVTGEADTIANDTTVSAGVGFKWGKTVLDTTLAAAGDGMIGTDAAHFLANASLTYTF